MNRSLNTVGLVIVLLAMLYAGFEVVTTVYRPWYSLGCLLAMILFFAILMWFMKERGEDDAIGRMGKFLWATL